jgi:hypothetical protein
VRPANPDGALRIGGLELAELDGGLGRASRVVSRTGGWSMKPLAIPLREQGRTNADATVTAPRTRG